MKVSSLFLFHGLALAWYVFLVAFISKIATGPGEKKPDNILAYGGPWKFLTVLNLVLQAVYFGISLLIDALVLMKQLRLAKSMFPFRDLIFGSLAFPTSMTVFTLFWALYLYDRELVYPKSLDAVLPLWLNHAMHTIILPLSLMDLLITPHRSPSKGKGISILVIGGAAYGCWSLWIYSVTGKWVYPLFEKLSAPGIAAIFVGSVFLTLFCYNTGEFLVRMIWGDSVVILDIYKKKSK
ncbi:androgen-dependent TFPI-regulating protein [Podarcis lilfordi]|uniref:Androgen-dependent TFPI-regulating protein n=1 Tax=Podarcis lilfordi TaxID=74358 RepID=A0AA35PBN9_9SAUR|nr:androgen-dependent TFPI-regulating protein [Podarcis lilfordi]